MKQIAKVEIQKLRQLAEVLETVPPHRFDLERWESEAPKPARTMFFGLIELEPACGFAGCAMGWAAHLGIFDGLKIEDGALTYKGVTHYRAAARLLGITEKMAEFLFNPDFYHAAEGTEPGDVSSRVTNFCDRIERLLTRKSKRSLRVVA